MNNEQNMINFSPIHTHIQEFFLSNIREKYPDLTEFDNVEIDNFKRKLASDIILEIVKQKYAPLQNIFLTNKKPSFNDDGKLINYPEMYFEFENYVSQNLSSITTDFIEKHFTLVRHISINEDQNTLTLTFEVYKTLE
jgi:hypothetical protein